MLSCRHLCDDTKSLPALVISSPTAFGHVEYAPNMFERVSDNGALPDGDVKRLDENVASILA